MGREELAIRMRSAYRTLLHIKRLKGPHVRVHFGTYQPIKRAIQNVEIAAKREGINLHVNR
jgi:hypothetical protein